MRYRDTLLIYGAEKKTRGVCSLGFAPFARTVSRVESDVVSLARPIVCWWVERAGLEGARARVLFKSLKDTATRLQGAGGWGAVTAET